ncbi:hypothetical protein ABZT43_22055 [Streptomyces sp. NPDC005349]|uniref:hypothetical protein n=1 Tax=Streptomyces sp. NPDC005349 TaxID=3157037 RepID=UPI0033B2ED8C
MTAAPITPGILTAAPITPVPVPDYPPTPPAKKNRTNTYIIGGATIAIAAIITAGVITANSRGSNEAAPTPTVTVTVTETAAPEEGRNRASRTPTSRPAKRPATGEPTSRSPW